MNKYKNFFGIFFIALVLFILPSLVHASNTLVISEIFYDAPGADSDHEWIEIHNVSSIPITLVGGSGTESWRFNDGSNHYLAENPTHGAMTIPSDGYAVIAGNADVFMTDHSGFSGTVIDTSMSLPNTTGTVKIVDGSGNVVDTATYSSALGAGGDGNSLQLSSSGSWTPATPTPGAGPQGSTTNGTGTTTGSGGGSPPPPVTKAVEIPKMKAEITVLPENVAGIPVEISGKVFGLSGELRQYGDFYFALGDGTIKKMTYLEPFEHIYKFPGTYVINLYFKSNPYVKEPEIKTRQTIEVVAPHVLISGVGESGEIEIQNPSDSEADISLWNIISTSKIFKIPDGTYVLPGKTIVLPTDITGLSSADVSSLRLVLPSGVVVSEYPNVAMPVRKSVTTYTDNTLSVKSNSEPAPADNGSEISPLSANVLSGIASAGAENKGNSKIPTVVFLFIGIIGLAGASFIAFRHRNLFMSGINGAENIPLSETEKIANSIRIIEEE